MKRDRTSWPGQAGPKGGTQSRPQPRPLNATRLEEMALAYVARFATTQAKLEAYLKRKLRERGWADETEPQINSLSARFVAAHYIDDAAYARMKTGSLLRRGYGVRRVAQSLDAAGVAEEHRLSTRPGIGAQRQAALQLARKRRFGPFSPQVLDRAAKEKQLAAMLRAGHPLDNAREIVNATSIEAAEDWAAQVEPDEAEDIT